MTPEAHGGEGLLSGVRILAFTTAIAGPYASRTLAQCGAEVVKIESRSGGIDSFRYFGPTPDLDASTRFGEMNGGVLSATLDLKNPEGNRLVRELAARSDIVLDNFRPDVLDRLGLGYRTLSSDRPSAIVIKLPGMGSDGPKSWYGTWGQTLSAFTGLTYLWNHRDQPRPMGSQTAYPDYVVACLAPVVAVAALLHRQRTHRGGLYEMAQFEAVGFLLGIELIDALVNRREPKPQGNRRPGFAPHGAFPCRGDDRWCAVAISSDKQWASLCEEMARADLIRDPRFATHDGRTANQDELELLLGAWTSTLDAHVLMRRLQRRGVPAGVLQTAEDLAQDPQLRRRGFVQRVTQPVLGELTVTGLAFSLLGGGLVPARGASRLGADTEYVVRGILRRDAAEYARLKEVGAIV